MRVPKKQKLLCAWIMILAGSSKVNSFERLTLTRFFFGLKLYRVFGLFDSATFVRLPCPGKRLAQATFAPSTAA